MTNYESLELEVIQLSDQYLIPEDVNRSREFTINHMIGNLLFSWNISAGADSIGVAPEDKTVLSFGFRGMTGYVEASYMKGQEPSVRLLRDSTTYMELLDHDKAPNLFADVSRVMQDIDEIKPNTYLSRENPLASESYTRLHRIILDKTFQGNISARAPEVNLNHASELVKKSKGVTVATNRTAAVDTSSGLLAIFDRKIEYPVWEDWRARVTKHERIMCVEPDTINLGQITVGDAISSITHDDTSQEQMLLLRDILKTAQPI